MSLVLIAIALILAAATWPLHLAHVSIATRVASVGLVIAGLAGASLFSADAEAFKGNPAPVAFFETLPASRVIATFCALGGFVLLGGLAVRVVTPISWSSASITQQTGIRLHPGVLIFPVTVGVFEIVGVGPAIIIDAPVYLATSGPLLLAKLAEGLMPFAVIVAAIVAFGGDRQTRAAKVGAASILVVLEILLVARASRSSAVFFLYIFAGAWLTGRWGTRQAAVRGVLSGVIALGLIGVPLRLRQGPTFGLTGVLSQLSRDPGGLFSGSSDPLNNVLLGVPLNMWVGSQVPQIPAHVFWVSVTPLPSGLTDYAYWNDVLKILPTEPYPGIGELLNLGWPYTAGFFICTGAAFEALTLIGRHARGHLASANQGIVVGLAGLFVIRATQYQLRTEARYIYYAAVLIIAVTLGSRLTIRHGVQSGRQQGRSGKAIAPASPQIDKSPTTTIAGR